MQQYLVRAHTALGIRYLTHYYNETSYKSGWSPYRSDAVTYNSAEDAQRALNDCMDRLEMPGDLMDQDIQQA